MQGKDIEVGGTVYRAEIEYGIKTAKVKVLGKGLAVRRGRGSTQNNGVEVELLQRCASPYGTLRYHEAGTKFTITSRNILAPWTEEDQAKADADWEKALRAARVSERLKALGFERAATRTGVQLNMGDIERLLDLAEANQPDAAVNSRSDHEALQHARARFRGRPDAWIVGELEKRLAAAHRETQALKRTAEDVAITRADQAARDDAAALEGDVR